MCQQFRGEYIYTAEQDHHFPELSVGETFEFAAACREPSYSNTDKTYKSQYAISMKEALLSAFNLWGVVDSKLGNDAVRGVSGGERKRVTIAESLLGRAPFQCWDNSTRGLDSATALRFVQVLRAYTVSSEAAAAVSLYQASQAIYDTFDKVVVLYHGRQIYFGLITSATAYFEKLGFVCPDHVTTADFLSALTHPPEATSFVRESYESRIPRCADDFARLWCNSVERQRVMEDICAFDMDFAVNSNHLWDFEASRRSEKATSL
jgi:ATP-binding cassette subfamily G (WHITE) protein 2 (PDR)